MLLKFLIAIPLTLIRSLVAIPLILIRSLIAIPLILIRLLLKLLKGSLLSILIKAIINA